MILKGCRKKWDETYYGIQRKKNILTKVYAITKEEYKKWRV
jgi:hypothetical protein